MIALMAQNDFHCQSTLSSTLNENGTIYYDQGEEVLFERIWQRRLCEIQESSKCIFFHILIYFHIYLEFFRQQVLADSLFLTH